MQNRVDLNKNHTTVDVNISGFESHISMPIREMSKFCYSSEKQNVPCHVLFPVQNVPCTERPWLNKRFRMQKMVNVRMPRFNRGGVIHPWAVGVPPERRSPPAPESQSRPPSWPGGSGPRGWPCCRAPWPPGER